MTTNMPSEVQVVEVNVLLKSGKKLIFHMALKNLDTGKNITQSRN